VLDTIGRRHAVALPKVSKASLAFGFPAISSVGRPPIRDRRLMARKCGQLINASQSGQLAMRRVGARSFAPDREGPRKITYPALSLFREEEARRPKVVVIGQTFLSRDQCRRALDSHGDDGRPVQSRRVDR
jgi:hypothetical protein